MDPQSRRSSQGTFEVLQHFSAEGSGALDRLVREFETRNSGTTVENNDVHISQLRLRVKSRILQADPPDVWDEWPGANLAPTVEAGVVGDVTDLWEDNGFDSTFAAEAERSARFDGRYHCVPLDMYRINNLYYNRELCEEAGVDPESARTPDDFLDMLATLDAELDQSALVFFGRDPYGALQTWETLVVGHGGARVYEALLDGEADRHRETIRAAMETLDAALEYTDDDVEFITAMDADRRFAEHRGAVHVNGMWAIGRIAGTDGFDYGTDWGHVPFPGTRGSALVNMNALVPSEESVNDDAVRRFLSFAGSADGQRIFNAEVGGIPPRTDVSVESLHPLIQEQQRALERADDQLRSMGHGLGVDPEQLVDLKETMATYLQDRDVAAATESIVASL